MTTLPEGYLENYEAIAKDHPWASTETDAMTELVAYSIQLLGVPYNARVLDVGCGNGYMLGGLANTNTYGVDISHVNCRRTREISTSSEVIQADAQTLPLKDQSFDVAI